MRRDRSRCRCGGAMAPRPNRLCARSGDVFCAQECDACGRVVERRVRRSPLWWSLQPMSVLAANALTAQMAVAQSRHRR